MLPSKPDKKEYTQCHLYKIPENAKQSLVTGSRSSLSGRGQRGKEGLQQVLRTLLGVMDMFILLFVEMVFWSVHIYKLVKFCILQNASYILIKFFKRGLCYLHSVTKSSKGHLLNNNHIPMPGHSFILQALLICDRDR